MAGVTFTAFAGQSMLSVGRIPAVVVVCDRSNRRCIGGGELFASARAVGIDGARQISATTGGCGGATFGAPEPASRTGANSGSGLKKNGSAGRSVLGDALSNAPGSPSRHEERSEDTPCGKSRTNDTAETKTPRPDPSR